MLFPTKWQLIPIGTSLILSRFINISLLPCMCRILINSTNSHIKISCVRKSTCMKYWLTNTEKCSISFFSVPWSVITKCCVFFFPLTCLRMKEKQIPFNFLKHKISMSFPNSVKELFYSSEYFQKPLKFKEDRNRICPGLACDFRCVCKSLSAALSLLIRSLLRGVTS